MSSSFADLGVSAPMVDALAVRGIARPFPIQRLVIADVLAGRDVLAQSPTGSGKTLAFAVPLIDRLGRGEPRPAALVLAPTRELAVQIVDDAGPLAAARGLDVAAVYGGVGFEKQIRAARRAQMLVATPGRLEDLMARGAVSLAGVRILVLDEADRMLDMGFRPAVDRIVAACPRIARRCSSRRRWMARRAVWRPPTRATRCAVCTRRRLPPVRSSSTGSWLSSTSTSCRR